MGKFRIQPHVRLQEWVAEEHDYFRAEGLDYDFEASLAGHPDHATAGRLLSGYGGMVAFDVAGGREAGLRFITALRLAAMAPSLGGVETLVLHPASTSHRQLDAAGLRAAGIGEGSIRVSVGLEHPEDLWADFEQALAAASPA